ncbi:MAG: hypothetical protein LCH31_05775 [Actinobacteria bacterium]|nr:hypothetical protein [Actinomycetota bacterium]
MRRVMQIDAQISFLISEDRRNYAKLDGPLRRVAILVGSGNFDEPDAESCLENWADEFMGVLASLVSTSSTNERVDE